MELLEILLTSGGGIAIITAVIKLAQHLEKKIKRKDYRTAQERHREGWRSISRVYEAMSCLIDFGSIDRVFLLEVSNGGHAPQPGSAIYARAIHAKHVDRLLEQDMKINYEKVKIDDAYISMIIAAHSQENRPYKFDVKHHPECLLKDLYTAENVQYSEVFHICTDPVDQKTFILSVATMQEDEKFSNPQLRSAINAEVMKIKSEFDKARALA